MNTSSNLTQRQSPILGRRAHRTATTCLLALAGVACASAPVMAQGDVVAVVPKEPVKKDRILDGPPTKLAFKNVTVDQIVPFIVEATGKVVLPQQDILSRKNITVMSDGEVSRKVALHMLYLALQQNQIAVIVHDDRIVLRDIMELTRGDVPVIGPDESMKDRDDLGAMVEKVFTLKFVTSKKFGDAIKGGLPDYAKLTLDEESNRIAILGSVALAKRIEALVAAIDRPRAGAMQTQTYRLKHAEAASVAQNIDDLFGQTQTGGGNQNQYQQWNYGRRGGGEEDSGATVGEIRVASNTQQNSVTVSADPAILREISALIEREWDQPLDPSSVINEVFLLKNSDPVKVKDALEQMFGKASTATTGAAQNRPQGQGQQQGQQSAPAAGQGAGRLAGQFTFQAFPDSNRLIVIARSQDNLKVVQDIIEQLDQPQTIGLPEVIDLKHANAEDLAEQLNVLLAQDGTLATLRRGESGLSSGASAGASPFAVSATTTTDGTTDSTTTSGENVTYWWQRATRATADQRLASNLVGKIRIVPVWRQNAVMVIAPPEYRNSVSTLIGSLDKPGRQVLISAIVAEISRDDSLAFGLRWGSGAISASSPDNTIGVGTEMTGTANDFASSIFDTSVLESTVNVNVLLSALAQKTTVSILSEPKIFTSDNQEAEFFDGQDIPFVTDTQTNSTSGNLVQSFDYRAVGIQLRIRPRVTPRREVDLRVNLELSSIVPGQTLFGGFVVDRRETTTQLIVGDRQTIVVSGILRSEDSSIVRKFPLLGDIPLLGELFKSREKTKTTTELLIFITPMVIENMEEADTVNKPFRTELERQREIMKGKVEQTDLQHDLLVPIDSDSQVKDPESSATPATPKD
jgi:general secretion pathway protein D